jgi:hypothetical protein
MIGHRFLFLAIDWSQFLMISAVRITARIKQGRGRNMDGRNVFWLPTKIATVAR